MSTTTIDSDAAAAVQLRNQVEVVFSPEYNSIHDYAALRDFDAKRSGKIASILQQHSRRMRFISAIGPIEDDDLLLVHTQNHLDCLHNAEFVLRSFGTGGGMSVAMGLFPMSLLLDSFVTDMVDSARWMAGGTVRAMRLVHSSGGCRVAINLAGGFNHTTFNDLDGNNRGCILADIPLAVEQLLEIDPAQKVAIVDLDALQADGLEEYAGHRPEETFVFDMFNRNEFPNDSRGFLKNATKAIPLDGGKLEHSVSLFGESYDTTDFDLLSCTKKTVGRCIGDEPYLSTLKEELPKFLDSVHPTTVFFNAGSGAHFQDSQGALALTTAGIVARDQYVVEQVCKMRNIPLVITMGRGTGPASCEVVAASVANLIGLMPERVD